MQRAPCGDKPATGVAPHMAAAEVRARLGDGNSGGPYQVADEIMQGLFTAAVGDVVELLQSWKTIA